MRTNKNIYEKIISFENIKKAYHSAIRNKRRRPAVAQFLLLEENRLLDLYRHFSTEDWQHGRYQIVIIREPKARLISVAPFNDRVIHHAVHQIVAPILSRSFIYDSYACRLNKGTHRAILRFQEGLRKYPFVGRLDVRRFFLEIDWDVLLRCISTRIKDDKAMKILSKIIESGSGLYHNKKILQTLHKAPKSQIANKMS